MEEQLNHNSCIQCKHFHIIGDEAGCTRDDDWLPICPLSYCSLFDEETFKPVLKMRKEIWEFISKSHKQSDGNV